MWHDLISTHAAQCIRYGCKPPDLEKAVGLLRQALEVDEHHMTTLRGMARVLAMQYHYRAADSVYRKCLHM